ncbi:MAG: hypothetical protein ACR2ID_10160 [Chthoniobacterales bacterium]
MNEEKAPLFQLVDWDQKFENDRSRTRDACRFVCVANDLSDPALIELLLHPFGTHCDSVFLSMLRLCSRQRKPREGWLTDDGRRDGNPFTVDRLARLFRVEAIFVKLTIHACVARDVGWIRCVGDQPAWLTQGDQLLLEAIGKYEDQLSDVRIPAGLSPAFNGDSPVSTRLALRGPTAELSSLSAATPAASVIDGDNTTAALPADSPPTHLEGKGIEEKELLSRRADSSPNRDENIQTLEQAKAILGKLCEEVFGYGLRPTQWPEALEHKLVEVLPVPQKDFDLLDWFYRESPEHAVFKVTMRRQSFPALIDNLIGEIQKARSARKTIGLKDLGESDSKPRAEPEGWQALYQREYPNAYQWPSSFWGLTKAVRDELPALREKFKKATVGAAAE